MKPEAVIFDMDGVLIDSVPSAHRVRAATLAQYGVDIKTVPDPHGEEHKGGSLVTLLSAVKQHHGLSIDEEEFQNKVVEGMHRDLKNSGVAIDPDLRGFLQELKSSGVPMGVATSAPEQSTLNKLRILGIAEFLQVVITAKDVKEHKPHPESYLAAIKRLEALPGKSIIFEDSAAGVEAGRAAGAAVVGFTKYNEDKTPLAGTEITIDDWKGITYKTLEQLLA